MKLNVFVNGRAVAVLDSPDSFEYVLTYRPDTRPDDFVSLLMPVRTASWNWPGLHPFFQVSLPEGFLLQVLKEQLGPHLGASPLDLLTVVGRNTIGRVQVSSAQTLDEPALPFDVSALLQGDNSPQAFIELVRTYAASGVSGVVPKFLTPEARALFKKATIATDRYIVKGSSERLPSIALNEHLGMEVARRTRFPTPATQVSDDGQALVVERFDRQQGGIRLGFEDACSLLGFAPEDKYKSTWERVARLTREHVSAAHQRAALEQLAVTLLLTYALGNADCHTKNIGFLYSSLDDVRLAPIYDMLTIRVYDFYAQNPPGLSIDGRKTWAPRNALWRVLQQHFDIEPRQQRELADCVCNAVAEVVPELIRHTRETPGFGTIGSRMLVEWQEGLTRLRDRITVPVPDIAVASAQAAIPAVSPPAKHIPERVGASPLMASGARRRPTPAS
jgi:serine/threonine-protein kinase HipA